MNSGDSSGCQFIFSPFVIITLSAYGGLKINLSRPWQPE